MTITRQSLFEEIGTCDRQIADLNAAKAACFNAYRDQMKDEGERKAAVIKEIACCKAAFQRMRALETDADAVFEKDARVEEIVTELQKAELTGTVHATRVRAHEPVSCETSEREIRNEIAPPVAAPASDPVPAPTFDEFNDIPPFLRRPAPMQRASA